MASNPLLAFKSEILTQLILPKLEGLLYAEKGDLSVSELWKHFRETYDCTVSLREFKEWCGELNMKPQQITTWNLPEKEVIPMTQDQFNSMEVDAFLGVQTTHQGHQDVLEPTDSKINFDNE